MSISYRLVAATELDTTLLNVWRTIQSKSDAFASPYFCPEFTQLVASVRDDVRVVVIEDLGRPVGFFPFQRSFFGMGKPVGGALSDYHGVIAEPSSKWSVSELIRAAKLAVWTFDHLVDEAGKFDPYVTARATSPRIDLSAGYEKYMQGLRDKPSDFARKARKLAREVGEINFTLHESASSAIDCLIKWKSEQYRRTRIIDAFSVRWTGELLRRVMDVQTAEFAGVCSVLRAAGQIVAVHAGMRSRRVLHWWFPTYDPEFANFSPGIILLFRIAESLAATGITAIDLGKGDSQYKRSVTNGAIELQEGVVEVPSLLASARRMRRMAEAYATRGGPGTALRLPLKVIQRIEWTRKFH